MVIGGVPMVCLLIECWLFPVSCLFLVSQGLDVDIAAGCQCTCFAAVNGRCWQLCWVPTRLVRMSLRLLTLGHVLRGHFASIKLKFLTFYCSFESSIYQRDHFRGNRPIYLTIFSDQPKEMNKSHAVSLAEYKLKNAHSFGRFNKTMHEMYIRESSFLLARSERFSDQPRDVKNAHSLEAVTIFFSDQLIRVDVKNAHSLLAFTIFFLRPTHTGRS